MTNLPKTVTTVHLGDSAFDEERELFLSIDTDAQKRQWSKSQELHLDSVKSEISQKITRTAEQTWQALNNHFVRFQSRLLPIIETIRPAAVIDRIHQRKNEMEQDLNTRFDRYVQDSELKNEAMNNATSAYDKFRNENNLTRSASYLSLKSIITFFALMIVVESALNASLLWELTGILLAFGQTVLITSVNVVFGAALVGLLFRYKNLFSQKRWLALVPVPVVFLVLAFNLGVGHYRDALTEANVRAQQLLTNPDWENFSYEHIDNNFIDYTQQAMDRILTSPLGLDSVLSVLLIIVGIGFFGFAAHKWYSMLDSHPGYGKLDMERTKAHESYSNLKNSVRKEMEQIIETAQARISDERTKAINMRAQREDLMNRAERLRENYTRWIITLSLQQTELLKWYQDRHRQEHGESPQNSFDSNIPIDESLRQPPTFVPPDETNIEKVVKEVEKTIKTIRRLEKIHWKRFENELETRNS